MTAWQRRRGLKVSPASDPGIAHAETARVRVIYDRMGAVALDR